MLVLLYSVATIACASLQVVAFKTAGYSLGPYPYFILLAVSFSFCPIFFAVVAYINRKGDGFVEEVQTWRFRRRFAVIGILNALNGVFIIFSNPHVAGVTQAVLAQAVIPMTMGLAFLCVGARFSPAQYFAALIIFGPS